MRFEIRGTRYKSIPWQCTLCGAAVVHVDRHAEWHKRTEGIDYGAYLPLDFPGEPQ